MATTGERLSALEDRMTKLETDVTSIKNGMADLSDMADDVRKVLRWLKNGLPLVATAAVTSGIVSGRWGAFLQALFS
jgi:archaellum component FlaC